MNLLAMAGLATACAHDHDDKEWTKEELQELEDKWGYEVCFLSVSIDLHPSLNGPNTCYHDHHEHCSLTNLMTVAIWRNQHFCSP